MYTKNFQEFTSQLDLPFLETKLKHLRMIFKTLENKFGLKKNSHQKLIDLGAGNGSVIIYSALFYGIKSFGIEINHILVEEAKQRISLLKKARNINKRQLKNIRIKIGDFYQQNLKKFDFIYVYTLPSMQKYLNHVFLTAKKRAIFISYKYKLKGFNSYVKYEHKITHEKDNLKTTTYYYEKFL